MIKDEEKGTRRWIFCNRELVQRKQGQGMRRRGGEMRGVEVCHVQEPNKPNWGKQYVPSHELRQTISRKSG